MLSSQMVYPALYDKFVMKYSKVYLSLLVAVMILAACGSSSDSVPTEVTPPQKQPNKVVKDAFDLPVAKSDNLFNISGNMVVTPEYDAN